MRVKDNQDDIETIKITREPKLTMEGDSIIGTREYQQDTYFMIETEIGSLAVVCDGMGGMEHGEIASRKTVEKLVGDFESWQGEEAVSDFLKREAEDMDRLVAALTNENGEPLDAGTTVVSVIVVDNKLYWMSVGDSRIYILRGNEMLCATRDHNYGYLLEKRLEKGELSADEYEKEKRQAEALISYLGMNGLEMIDVNKVPFELEYGDRILLCSDGLYKCLSEEVLEDLLLYSNYEIKVTLNSLLEAVTQAPRRNKDNTTVILMAYE